MTYTILSETEMNKMMNKSPLTYEAYKQTYFVHFIMLVCVFLISVEIATS